MKRCVIACRLCKEDKNGNKNAFHISKPNNTSYIWCVYRHAEPLRRGEYEIRVDDTGAITGTTCYREKILPRTKMSREKSSSGGVL